MAYWATPFKMHFDFRPNIPLSTDPSRHQQGVHQRKSKHHFWKLGCCIWSLFLGTSESNVRQYQRQVQGCASRSWYLIWLWRSLTFGSLAATYEGKSKCAVPFSCRTPGGRGCLPLTSCHVDNDSQYPTFAKLSRIKNDLSRTRKKKSQGFPA